MPFSHFFCFLDVFFFQKVWSHTFCFWNFTFFEHQTKWNKAKCAAIWKGRGKEGKNQNFTRMDWHLSLLFAKVFSDFSKIIYFDIVIHALKICRKDLAICSNHSIIFPCDLVMIFVCVFCRRTSTDVTTQYKALKLPETVVTPWWIYLISILGGLLLLCIIIFIFYTVFVAGGHQLK